MASVLENLGFTAKQIEGVLEPEIQRLLEQEKVIRKIVDDLAAQSNALYEKRRENAQAFEALKVQIADNERKLNVERSEFLKEKEKLKDAQHNLLIREEKMRIDKEAFSAERSVHANQVRKDEAEILEGKKVISQLNDKQKKINDEYELLESKRIQTERDWEALKNAEKSFEVKKKEIEASASELSKKESLLAAELGKCQERITVNQAKTDKAMEDLASQKKELESKAQAEWESLKNREFEIIKKEKALKSQELDIQAKLRDIEIKESKFEAPKETPKEEVKKRGKKE